MNYRIHGVLLLCTFSLLSVEIKEIANKDTLTKVMNSGEPAILLFHTPQCHHCRTFQQPFEKVLKAEKRDGYKVNVAKEEFKDTVRTLDIRGFPTTIIIGCNGKELGRLVGAYSQEEFQAFLRKHPAICPNQKEQKPGKEEKVSLEKTLEQQEANLLHTIASTEQEVKQEVKVLKTLEDLTKVMENEALVLYHAKWCPACQNELPQYRNHIKEHNIKNAHEVDVDELPGVQKHNIRYLPTLVHYKDGKEVSRVEGGGEKLKELYKKTAK